MPITIRAGFDDSFDVEARWKSGTPGGSVVSGFQPTDPLFCDVWPGDDQPVTFHPAIAWSDAPNAKLTVSFPSASTASLDAGTYRILAWAFAGGVKVVVLDDQLVIEAGEATAATADVAIISYRDMRRYAGWLDTLADRETSTAGFLRERNEATRWFYSLVLRHYRGNMAGTVPTDFSLDHLYWGLRRSLLPPTDLVAWLAAGGLMLDATDLTSGKKIDLGVREVVAKHAIAQVCAAQLGPAKGNEYAYLARQFMQQAEERAKTLTVAIDSNGDGVPDLAIDLGAAEVVYS